MRMELLNLVIVTAWFTCVKALVLAHFEDVKPSTISATNNVLTIRLGWSQSDEAASKNVSYYFALGLNGSPDFNVTGNETIAANNSSPVLVRFPIPRNISGNGELLAIPVNYSGWLAQGIFIPGFDIGVTYLAESSPEDSPQTVATTNSTDTLTRAFPSLSSNGMSSITSIPPETSHTSTAGSENETHSANPSPDTSGTPKNTVAGAVVGATLSLSAIVILIWYYRRRMNSRQHLQLSQPTIVPYKDRLDAVTKRRRKGRRSSVTENTPPVRAALQHPNHVDIIDPNQPRNIAVREPRLVFHDDSGWRPLPRPLTQREEEGTSTYVIDMPPRNPSEKTIRDVEGDEMGSITFNPSAKAQSSDKYIFCEGPEVDD